MRCVLSAESITKYFGGLRAVDGVDIALDEGEILGLIGPNGAGKTTLLNLISGLLYPTSGKIFFKGEEIQSLPAHLRARMGIARTFQIVRPFANLSVKENVLVGRGCQYYGKIRSLFGRCRVSHTEAQVEEILDFVGLLRLKGQAAATLPIGLLRRLEIARALALNPAILLLDEPAAGLNEQELKDLQVLICRIREQNVTSMLVEHTMRFVMALCKQVVVMDHGKKIAEGTPREVTMDKRVIEVYLGSSEEVNAT